MAKLTKEKVEAISEDPEKHAFALVTISLLADQLLAAMDVVEAERVSPYRRTMRVAQALKRYDELSGGTPSEEDKDNANVSTPGSGEAGTNRTG